jgi:tellurite resistance protein TerC
MGTQELIWIGFFIFIIAMLALDLGVLNRKSHVIKPKEAILLSIFWISLAIVFNVFVWAFMGEQKAMEFATGYVMEKALSVDNLFVFVLVFSYFCVPAKSHHKVLFWGVIGALVFRGIFIVAGIALIEQFAWIIYVFGAFLIITSIKILLQGEKKVDPEKNLFIKIYRRFFPVTEEFHEDKFFIRKAGILIATPLFLTLLFVEATDLVFAVDSIPAVLAITTDPFIVYTSNAFAILGLRSLYFALASALPSFHYLKYGLAAILTFVGAKMMLVDFLHISVLVSLLVIVLILVISIIASMVMNRKRAKGPVEKAD